MNEPATHVFELRVGADHPALPGHFPGRPIVPGVVLLEHVLAGAERWLSRSVHVGSLQQAKFTRPLLPEQAATVSLALRGDELKFEIVRDAARLAQGVFKLARIANEGSGE
jgi:3-hydroxymyristoyl/3-hydroxydecanoyl-(acyl carrier protein) dehydratase